MSLDKFLVFTIVSSVEYVAIFALIFSLFRIALRGYKPQIAFVCISLSYLSFTMRADLLSPYAPIVQVVVLIIFMWLLFRFQIFYAAVMSVIGYFAYGLLQGVILFIASFFIHGINPFTFEMYSVAIITGGISLIISGFIRKRNWGFAFIPHNEEERVNYRTKENFMLLVVMLLSVIGLVVTYSFAVAVDISTSFVITLVFLLLSVSILIYISRKKDEKEVI